MTIPSTCATKLCFSRSSYTGKERDTESGNDYFGARYYSSNMGRFMSPDEAFADQHPANPQSLNLYEYGRNNPFKFTDPTGESVYAEIHTVGNGENDNRNSPDGGDATFKQAAETRANDIRHSKDFDPKKDVALVLSANSKQDFIDDLNTIRGLESTFGKVAELGLYSHSGNDGPVFPGGAKASDRQFIAPGQKHGIDSNQLGALPIHWESNAWADFQSCHSAKFAEAFSHAQGVHTFGYKGFVSFFATEGGLLGEYPYSRANTKPGYNGPIYPSSAHPLFGGYNDEHVKHLP